MNFIHYMKNFSWIPPADSSIPQIQTLLWQRGQHMAALERIRMGSNDNLDEAEHRQDSAVSSTESWKFDQHRHLQGFLYKNISVSFY